LLDGVRVLLAEPSIEIAPSIAPCLKTFEKVRILVDRQNLRLDAIKRPIFDRCDETERLVFLEDNAAGSRKLPVHRKCEGEPVGFDDAIERCDTVLWQVWRSAGPNRNARFGTKQVPGVEGQYPVTEMRRDESIICPRAINPDYNVGQTAISIPFSDHA
jgi:hypothetical protein